MTHWRTPYQRRRRPIVPALALIWIGLPAAWLILLGGLCYQVLR